jgi:hypothetical protein
LIAFSFAASVYAQESSYKEKTIRIVVRDDDMERVIAGLFKLDSGPVAKLKDVLYK